MKWYLKNLRAWAIASVSMVSLAMSLTSCLDDDDDDAYYLSIPNALVTVKPTADNAFYLQLDDSTTLFATKMSNSPFGEKEVRALTNFEVVNEPANGYNKAVHINWIDSILTKSIAPDMGLKNDSIYGTNEVEIINDWVTIAEDGYLTLRFRTMNAYPGAKHFVNLLMSKDPEHPYEVEFRHNAFGDNYGPMADGLVAFKLDSLPDTNGETVKLKLKWRSFSGDKSAEFDYCTRKSTPAKAAIAEEKSSLNLN